MGGERVKITLRRISDGEVRTIMETWGDYPAAQYNWLEGNYSCDCNRHMAFARAAGREADEDVECGDDRLYRVDKIERLGCGT